MEEEDGMRWGVIRSGSGVGGVNSLSSLYWTVDQGVDDGGHEARDHVFGRDGKAMGVGGIMCHVKSAGERGWEEEEGWYGFTADRQAALAVC
jgi:hypothetical protein